MTARSLLRLIRPINLALLWAATETGSRLAGGPSWTPCGLLPSFVAAFGYARNDAVDLEADRLNRPERPVPAGDISVRFALGLSWALLALGAILAWRLAVQPAHAVLYVAGAIVLYFYSPWLKRLGALGPLSVAFLAGLAVLWGGFLGVEPRRAMAAAGLAAAVTAARECAKDLEDVEGDRQAGKRTLPVRAGEGPPRLALRLSAGVALALIPVPWVLGDAGYAYLALSSIIAAPILAWFAWRPPADALEARGASRWLKVALASGIAGLWLGARAP